MKSPFKNKNILVTGGTGSIGSEIVKQLIKYKPKQIRVFSRDETKQLTLQQELNALNNKIDIRYLIGDIRDKNRLDMAFGGIDIVFHTAALKHVSFCEYNPFEAVKTNVYGTQNVIDLSIKHDVEKVISISTDKAVNPINIMGTTKLLMEKLILSTRWYLGKSTTIFSVVRFGNVINSRGSVVPLWREQIKKGLPVTVTDARMTRYIMSLNNAVSLIFKAAAIMKGQEIFILKMPQRRIIDLMEEVIRNENKGSQIKIKMIGRKDGEKLQEVLFTDEDKQSIIELDDMYIVIPYSDIFKSRSKKSYRKT